MRSDPARYPTVTPRRSVEIVRNANFLNIIAPQMGLESLPYDTALRALSSGALGAVIDVERTSNAQKGRGERPIALATDGQTTVGGVTLELRRP
jgi:hypothetical protein